MSRLKEDKKMKTNSVKYGPSLFSEHDIYFFKEGSHFKLYDKLGAHEMSINGVNGVYFAIWVPNAKGVFVIGDFNGWDRTKHPLAVRWDSSGIWEGFIPGLKRGDLYKFYIISKHNGYRVEKTDPFGFYWEVSPKTATRVWNLDYQWNDSGWMDNRAKFNNIEAPISIYEVHLGSWMRNVEDGNKFLTYKELAPKLADYVKRMGFTHVEFLPVMEHPFYGSWGYQTLGYFAPTSRYGEPGDFMYLVDCLHKNNIGVILDWVPSHFPSDVHGLIYGDGTHLYEHADYKKGFHPDWQSYIFNYGRNEVKNFLISSAMFWLDKYHVDGLRVDAVASMLYLDYSRKVGEWVPNEFGGRENLEAINFIKKLNETLYSNFPGIMMFAEESTAWPMVSKPTYVGGLGFGMKWNMGWMHDTLDYFSKDPIHRKYHQEELSFSLWYGFTENFVLVLSHDEVVHGKSAILSKMPGDYWQKRANLRLLMGYMYLHPGKKLLFMGTEIGQWDEWNHQKSLDWHLLKYEDHRQLQNWVGYLNHFYKNEPALYELDCFYEGFRWIDFSDWEGSIISFYRKAKTNNDIIIAAFNFTPVPRFNYRIGAPLGGTWREIMNSDAKEFGGSGLGNFGRVCAEPIAFHGLNFSLSLTIPPLAMVVFKS